jgi:hypothetical protein
MAFRSRRVTDDLVLAAVVVNKHPILDPAQRNFPKVVEPPRQETMAVAIGRRARPKNVRARRQLLQIGRRREGMRVGDLVQTRAG